ncbi:indigoidine synthase a-like protein [Grosmannia clavigera kw1407]|uniref:Indigoidine synthase a-like protein n=1 Tax=Grosmannia clavigera (strain kw1407 / UAMH 11150) TaxID=655863 RepID=F0XKE8_GROCL|nr:indigoidine synthase a-like protein [Grosmannia clavigera kw1407]EFX01566.1 indigoidine synthase a-like protein [Grosmannia clavigera kw1407]
MAIPWRQLAGRASTGRRIYGHQRGLHHTRRLSSGPARGLGGLLRVTEEVADAVATNRAVVALESTIYTHGAIGEDLRLEAIVRENGAVPAVIGVLDGRPTVGLQPDEIARMVDEGAQKASRRDLAQLVGRPGSKHKRHGGTTISGTMILARLAGIRVFGTGGLGGVHRGWQQHMDVSADLSELGRTRVAVVCSGSKGFLDTAATLEYLETQGVYVATFADGRPTGPKAVPIPFPAFWAREGSVLSPSVVLDEAEAASIILAQEQLAIETGLLFANPIPAAAAIPRAQMDEAIDRAVTEAAAKGFSGARNTPYVLQRIRELTDGRSVGANLALVRDNVRRAAKVAVQLSKLLANGDESMQQPVHTKIVPEVPQADILVAGSVAIDLSCDYVSNNDSRPADLQLHVSNPAAIRQTVGGVGHNVALAAHRVSPSTRVKLCTLVGDDIAGATILSAMQTAGLDTTGVQQLGHEHSGARTAQYVAINGADKSLVVAMADMDIFARDDATNGCSSAVTAAAPRWVVVDGNWRPAGLHGWIAAAREAGAHVAFEPVSAAKSSRLFRGDSHLDGRLPLVDLATPNEHELAAMHAAASARGLLTADPRWFAVIGRLGLMAGARDRFVRLTSAALVDAGVPQQAVQLLPYIPTVVTKLGSRGALLTRLLAPDDPLLHDRSAEAHILVRAPLDDGDGDLNYQPVGGVYMRLFPAAAVDDAHIVSVNGVGDTFLGALVGGLAQGGQTHRLMEVAQQAAALTLRSPEAVAADLGGLADTLSRASAE